MTLLLQATPSYETYNEPAQISLSANRIADLDRRGVTWRKFNEINVVDLNYKNTNYDGWAPMPSGLNSDVRLISK